MKVLIIDDEVDAYDMYRMRFRKEIHAEEIILYHALNGKEGLHYVYNEVIDVVILDLVMPFHDGHYFLAESKKYEESGGFRPIIIVVTALWDITSVRKVIRGDAFDYFTKPLNFEKFRSCLYEAYEISCQRRKEHEVDKLSRENLKVYQRFLKKSEIISEIDDE